MHGSGGFVERRVHDRNQVGAYSVRTPNRVHVAAGQYLYSTSPSTKERARLPLSACSALLGAVTITSYLERAIYFRSLSSITTRWIGLVPMFSVQWVMGSR